MAMDGIKGSGLTNPSILDRFQVNGKSTDNADKAKGTQDGIHKGTVPADTAEISDTAHQLMDLRATVDIGRVAIANEPEVREEKIAQARQRLEEGYYNSQMVTDKVAGILGNVLNKIDEL